MLISKHFFMQKSQLTFIIILSNDIAWGGTILNFYVTKQESITIIILGLFVIFIDITQSGIKLLKWNEDVMQLLINSMSKNKVKNQIIYFFNISWIINNI